MADRFSALTVILDRDMRDDDAAPLIAAINQFCGVQQVVPVVSDPLSLAAESRARADLGARLWEALNG